MKILLGAAVLWLAMAAARVVLVRRVRPQLPARVTTSWFFPLLRPWRVRLRLSNVAMHTGIRLRRESWPEKAGLPLTKARPNRENWHSDRNDIRLRAFDFDDRIDVRGPRDEAVSLLSHEARMILVELFDVERGRLRGGVITCDALAVCVLKRAQDVVRLAEIFEERTKRGVRECLAEMALKDESDSVRLVANAYLREMAPEAPEVAQGNREAADKEDGELWYRVGGIQSLPVAEQIPRWRAILATEREWGILFAIALDSLITLDPSAPAEDLCIEVLERKKRNPELILEALRLLGAKTGTARALRAMGAQTDLNVNVKNMTLGESTNVAEFAKVAMKTLRSRLGIDADDGGGLALSGESREGALSAPAAEGAVSVAKKTTN